MIGNLWSTNKCRDTLLLIATYFHAQLYKNISAFISTTCHISNIEVPVDIYENIRPMIIDELVPIDVLANAILKIAPRSVRDGEDWFALQCIYRMLQSKLFRMHNVDASEWVYKQLLCCNDTDPLPSTITDIISEFVSK